MLEYERIEIDCCMGCGGIWLDAGELELLLGSPGLVKEFMSGGDPSHAAGEQSRPCPVCDASMRKGVTAGAPAVVHDVCPVAHGMRFDGGELATVLRQLQEHAGASAVLQWLHRLFAAADTPSGR